MFVPGYLDMQQVIKIFDELVKVFPENGVSKNAFLLVCQVIDSTRDLTAINEQCEYGGLIGPGNSFLHPLLQKSKPFRVHAVFHDAFGFMKEKYNLGPGYVYTLWGRNLCSETAAFRAISPTCFFGCIEN